MQITKENLSSLKIRTDPTERRIVLYFKGEAEIGSYGRKTSEDWIDEIWRRIRQEVSDFSEFDKLEFDLSQVSYLAGTGCGILVGLYAKAKTLNLEFSVSGAQPEITEVIKLAKLNTVFQLT